MTPVRTECRHHNARSVTQEHWPRGLGDAHRITDGGRRRRLRHHHFRAALTWLLDALDGVGSNERRVQKNESIWPRCASDWTLTIQAPGSTACNHSEFFPKVVSIRMRQRNKIRHIWNRESFHERNKVSVKHHSQANFAGPSSSLSSISLGCPTSSSSSPKYSLLSWSFIHDSCIHQAEGPKELNSLFVVRITPM